MLGLILPEGECDPTRIAFDVQNFGFDGADVGELLRAHGIEPEYAGLGKIILIPSVMNTEEDFDRLDSALVDIFSKAVPCGKTPIGVNAFLPRISMTPREALPAEAYCPCPPAIPAAMPGEILGEREIEELRRYGIFNIKVVK